MVSVIVPVYKVEPYLRQCVDSILAQTYKDLQVILVDDGSPDDCGRIIDEYAEKDARVLALHKVNAGQASARNLALKHAKGEYIAFVDSDDYIAKDMYEKLVAILEEAKADIAGCRFQRFHDGEEGFFENQQKKQFESAYLSVFTKNETLAKMFQSEIGWSVWSKLYKAELFEGITFPVGYLCEDKDVNYRAFIKSEKTVFTSEKLYFYRIRKNSTMDVKSLLYCESNLKINDRMEADLREIGDSEVLCKLEAYLAKCYFITYCDTYNKEGYDHIVKKSLSELRKRYRWIHKADYLKFYERWPIWIAGWTMIGERANIITKMIAKLYCYVVKKR